MSTVTFAHTLRKTREFSEYGMPRAAPAQSTGGGHVQQGHRCLTRRIEPEAIRDWHRRAAAQQTAPDPKRQTCDAGVAPDPLAPDWADAIWLSGVRLGMLVHESAVAATLD
ncbi:hypothetical protein ACI3L1_15705 [Deinococcus sp. SM5_A1]|uniref:hypothetical protein n=1 Tax=Deinococcus sp. SM5_A1 TaxID=3379094 RepID=UPI00385AD3E7